MYSLLHAHATCFPVLIRAWTTFQVFCIFVHCTHANILPLMLVFAGVQDRCDPLLQHGASPARPWLRSNLPERHDSRRTVPD